MAGLTAGATIRVLPRRLKSSIMCVLRPAESAVRRLIVVTQFRLNLDDLTLAPSTRLSPKPDFSKFTGDRAASEPAFPLFDSLKNFDDKPAIRRSKSVPRISLPGIFDPVFEPPKLAPTPEDDVDATHLLARLKALQGALIDLPKQAKRLARKVARARQDEDRRKRVYALRPGKAPGHRKRHKHPVDEVLAQCQWLKWEIREAMWRERQANAP